MRTPQKLALCIVSRAYDVFASQRVDVNPNYLVKWGRVLLVLHCDISTVPLITNTCLVGRYLEAKQT